MARVAGINIPDRKQTWISLTHIYGIGRTTALKICASTGINYDTKIEALNEEDIEKLSFFAVAIIVSIPELPVILKPVLPVTESTNAPDAS